MVEMTLFCVQRGRFRNWVEISVVLMLEGLMVL